MKNETTIFDFARMIAGINAEERKKKQNDDDADLEDRIDLYSYFLYYGWIPEYRADYQINLKPYFDQGEGWKYDKIP